MNNSLDDMFGNNANLNDRAMNNIGMRENDEYNMRGMRDDHKKERTCGICGQTSVTVRKRRKKRSSRILLVCAISYGT